MSAKSRETIVGIDLGTTNSLVAISDESGARVFLDGDSALIPSVVAYDADGRVGAVGGRARTLRSVDPERILYSVKRLMGKGRADLEVCARDLPFDFSPSTNEMIRIQVGKRAVTAIEVSAEILRRCRFVAENHLGREVTKAVITVPAYFNDSQRVATSVAARLAGLEAVRVVNEPTAAALAFGIGKEKTSQIVAVYDFGGGTFDISILKVTDGIFEVLSTDGDTDLGGDNLDQAIANGLLARMTSAPKTSEDKALFMSQVELIKKSLTDQNEIDVTIHWANEIQWQGAVTRDEINVWMEPVIDRTIELTRRCLKASHLEVSQIQKVVMVGGSTRVPRVREAVGVFFKQIPDTSVDPEQVVALGAAVQASVLAGERSDTLLLDVVPLSLGLETMGGVVTKIIPRNTTIPCSVTEAFTTYQDNQTAVDLHIVQGERELVSACRSLGRFKLPVSPQPAGTIRILVHFVLDASGVLRVSAVNEATQEEAKLEVRPSFGLSDAEVEKMLTEAWEKADQDFAERQLIEARNQARALLRATEKSLSSPLLDAPYKVSQEAKLIPLMRALQEDLRSAGADVIAIRTKELEGMTQDLAETLLNRAVQQRLRDQRLETGS